MSDFAHEYEPGGGFGFGMNLQQLRLDHGLEAKEGSNLLFQGQKLVTTNVEFISRLE